MGVDAGRRQTPHGLCALYTVPSSACQGSLNVSQFSVEVNVLPSRFQPVSNSCSVLHWTVKPM
jgi:hypothetical protein